MLYQLHVLAKAMATAYRASSPFDSLHPFASRARRARSRHLAAASIIPLLAAGVASPAHATYPGENGVIVTGQIGLGSNHGCIKINPDGSVTQLGHGAQPTVSPSGKRIAYVKYGDIWVKNIDGTDVAHEHQPTTFR